MDNEGVMLRHRRYPDWLTQASGTSQQPPTTQDFADIFAFMMTQTH